MKVQPLNDKVLVRPKKVEETIHSGIVIKVDGKVENIRGEIIDFGKDVMLVQKGDTAIFSKYAGTEFKIDEVKHVLLSEHDIIGVEDK